MSENGIWDTCKGVLGPDMGSGDPCEGGLGPDLGSGGRDFRDFGELGDPDLGFLVDLAVRKWGF